MPSSNLDNTFQALADPTRRSIVNRLRTGNKTSLSELAAPFDMSLPGVMKHVGILESAGLVEREKIGRTVFCRLNAEPMAAAISWLQEMEQFWTSRLDALAENIELQSLNDKLGNEPPSPQPSTPKSASGKRKKK